MAPRKLTIYIDARCLLRPRDGVGTYAATLLKNMLAQDQQNNYIALGFADQKNAERLVPDAPNFRYHFLPLPRKVYMSLFRVWQLPVDAWLPTPADIVWYPDFVMAPRIHSGKKIVTIHDLTFIHDTATVEPKNLRYLQRFAPQAVRRAHTITCVSQAVAADITAAYQPAAPIHVIYPAAPAETPGTPNTKNPYILFVGTLQPRKNLAALLRAYALLPQPLQAMYRLVLVGRKGWNADTTTQSLLAKIPHTWVESPNDAERDRLYAGASLFVLPSHREGFGIPPIEALAHHVPVITSTDPALVEATGQAALHVPADDPQALATAIEQTLTSAEVRQNLAAQRTPVLAKLDGTKTAAAFVGLIHKVVGE